MNSLAGVGARSLAHRKGRSVLTALGIVLGVAILFGVLVTNASLDRAFGQLVDRYRKPWNDALARPVGVGDGVLPAEVADRVAALPDVLVASPSLGQSVSLPNVKPKEPDEPTQTMFLIGVDFATWRKLHRDTEELAEGRMATAPDEIIISARTPPHWGTRVGTDVLVRSPVGDRTLKIVGRFAPEPDEQEDTYHAIAALSLVQEIEAKGNVIDAVAIDLRDGTDVASWVGRHRSVLGPTVEMVDRGGNQEGFRPLLETIQSSLTFVAAIALFVGAFLIYLTLSMAVIERTRMYGTLRALGATGRQVRRLVLTEAAVLGGGSTIAGLALGLAMSVGLTRALTSLMEISRPPLVLAPSAVAIATVAGVVTTVVSAFVPARRAARLAPVAAMRGDHGADARLGRSWVVGVVMLAVSAAVIVRVRGITGMAVTTFFVLLGIVLLVPTILRPLARVLGALTRRAEPGVGDVAVMHLVKERSRSAYTLALVMVVFAMVFSMAAAQATMNKALARALETAFGSDLRGWSPNGLKPDLLQAITSTPDVTMISPLWFANARVTAKRDLANGVPDRDASRPLAIIDPGTYFSVAGFPWTDGTDTEVRRSFERGGGIVLPKSMATRLRLRRGDHVDVATTKGPQAFRVVGLYAGFGQPQPAFVGIRDGRELFAAGDPGGVAIELAKGTDGDEARRALQATAPAKRDGLYLETATAAKAQAEAQIGGFFRVFYSVLLVAAVVGLLGLTNTLAMSVLQRLREIGILRAVGTKRRQVRAMVAVESATLVLVALLLALPLGGLLSVLFVRTATESLGFTAPYAYPWLWVPGVGVIALLIGGLGALSPARRAARLDVVAALAYE